MLKAGSRNPGFEKASAIRPILDASFGWHDSPTALVRGRRARVVAAGARHLQFDIRRVVLFVCLLDPILVIHAYFQLAIADETVGRHDEEFGVAQLGVGHGEGLYFFPARRRLAYEPV